MAMVNIKIEGISYQVEEGLTILEAAKKCGYEIPSLCAFNHGECNQGSCRVCLVEATGARGLVASCVYPVAEGMEITISSPEEANMTLGAVDAALTQVNKQRADLGAYQNRFEMAAKGVNIAAENTQAAESRIRDTDMASEMVEFTKNSILTQAGTAMLAQANNQSQTVLALLQ